jgi:nucleoside-diphosphate kinase
MSMEQTLVILKPDSINRGLVGEILHRFERKGLKVIGVKMEMLKTEVLEEHYAHHKDKPYFPDIVAFMQSVPAIFMCLEGKDAVSVVRMMTGETLGRKATPGTIRGDFSISIQANLIHVSDSQKTAREEVKRFFSEKELHSYTKMDWDTIYSKDEKQ